MPFVKGQSGNPAGRPVGCKNKINRDFDLKLVEKTDYLADNIFSLFSNGNPTALRLVMQRMSPVAKGRPIEIDLPPLNSPADRPAAMEAIRVALCEGEITIDEASGLIGYVDKALGYDRTALAKGQLVALMREVVGLRSEVALMAGRLDAELGPDDITEESIDQRVRESLAGGDVIDANVVNINAESTIDPPAIESPTADADADVPPATEAGIELSVRNQSPLPKPAAAESHASGEDEVNERSKFNETDAAPAAAGSGDPVTRDAEAPYGTRPVPMTIGDDALALMQNLGQLDTELPDRMDARGEVRHTGLSRAAAVERMTMRAEAMVR